MCHKCRDMYATPFVSVSSINLLHQGDTFMNIHVNIHNM